MSNPHTFPMEKSHWETCELEEEEGREEKEEEKGRMRREVNRWREKGKRVTSNTSFEKNNIENANKWCSLHIFFRD